MNLITGATGLLGSYLAKLLLSKGEKVRAIRRTTSDISLLGECAQYIDWVEGDVLDISSLEEAMCDVIKVYHCAAVVTFIPSEINYMMKVNIEGTANVMNVALVNRVSKLIHVSSIAAFGVPRNDKVIDETFSDPNINKSFWYYRSKQYSEREAWRANEEGLHVVIVCPSTIIGAGWWDAEPNSLFQEIYTGLKFYTASTNGFVDVRDVASCIYQLMQSNISGEKYILNSENLSFRDVIWQIADEMKVKRPSIEAGNFLLGMAWRTEEIKSFITKQRPLITKESAELASINFTYTNEKIKRTLNYSFKSMKETITETANVFLKSKRERQEFGIFE